MAAAAALAAWIFRRPLNRILAWLFRRFNVGFDHSTNVYTRSVGGLLRVSVLVLVVYGGLLALTWWGFAKSPAGFIPAQDKGYLLVNVQLPDAASVERTERVMHRIEDLAHKTPGVKHTVAIAGQSILLGANAPNFGAMYVMLDDFHDRVATRPFRRGHRRPACRPISRQEIKDGLVNVLGAPPIDGLGTAGGFKIIVEDRGDNGLPALQHVGEKIVDDAEPDPRAGRSVQQLPRRHALAVPRHRPHPGQGPRRVDGRDLHRRCRSTWARCTSTTSTATAAPGRSTCRPTPSTASRWTTSSN